MNIRLVSPVRADETSLLSALVFWQLPAILFTTAVFLLGLIARRVIFAALLMLIGMAAYVPMGIVIAAQVSETPAVGFPTLLVISIVELVAGAIFLNTAWKRWAKLEVATL